MDIVFTINKLNVSSLSERLTVSVVMPVYNAERYLEEAVDSILKQSVDDFEFLIFDDGSTDRSVEILRSYKDRRIKVYFSDRNRGYTHWLNEGLEIARGKYVARMDADDVSLLNRFEKQVEFLEENPDVGVLGSNVWFINEEGKKLRIKENPKTDTEIRWVLLLDNPFIHPSMMFRRDLLVHNNLKYDPTYQPSEDYKLWSEMLTLCKGFNMEDPLVHYRLHDRQISNEDRKTQLYNHDRIAIQNIKNLRKDRDYPEGKVVRMRQFAQGCLLEDLVTVREVSVFLKDYMNLLDSFEQKMGNNSDWPRVKKQVYGILLRSADKAKNSLFGCYLLLRCFWGKLSFLSFFLRVRCEKVKVEKILYQN